MYVRLQYISVTRDIYPAHNTFPSSDLQVSPLLNKTNGNTMCTTSHFLFTILIKLHSPSIKHKIAQEYEYLTTTKKVLFMHGKYSKNCEMIIKFYCTQNVALWICNKTYRAGYGIR